MATRMDTTISLFTYFYNLNLNHRYNFPLPLLARIILEQESLIKKEISSLDIYNTSPVEVIKKLEEIKKNHCL